MDFTCVLAMDQTNGIGSAGQIPWANTPMGKDDLVDFKRYTTKCPGSAVIMGSNTARSIPNFPLPLRVNIVISRSSNDNVDDSVVFTKSLDEALDWCKTHNVPKVYVIGGASVFETAFQSPWCKKIRVTRIPGIYECDAFVNIPMEKYTELYTYNHDTGCIISMFKRTSSSDV